LTCHGEFFPLAGGPGAAASSRFTGLGPLSATEAVYPDFAARLAAQERVVITISNDSWFGRTIGPRAASAKAACARIEKVALDDSSAQTDGVTALIDHRAKIPPVSPSSSKPALNGWVQPRGAKPCYLAWEWPLGLAGCWPFCWSECRAPQAFPAAA